MKTINLPLDFAIQRRLRAWWLSGKFGALCSEGSRFASHHTHHVGTLDKSIRLDYTLFHSGAYLRGSFSGSNPHSNMNVLLLKSLKLYKNTTKFNATSRNVHPRSFPGYVPSFNPFPRVHFLK